MSQYPDEQSCKNKWKEIRIKQGVVCPKCGCKEYWWKSDKEHIKMIVIGDLKSETIDKQVKTHIDMDSIINSDDSTSYTNFKNLVKEHHAQVIPHDQIGKLLPWVHVAISNAKRLLLDIYHEISPEYLQSYLNEFCYKFNRRYFGDGLFDRMLLAGITYKNEFRYNIK